MPENFETQNSNSCFKEAVCVNASRIYDSCSDKDCLEDLRIYFTDEMQQIIDSAVNVKCKEVKVLKVEVEVENIPFNKGYYAIDLTYYFLVNIEVYQTMMSLPVKCEGVATFTKKVILYGSEGKVYTYSSDDNNSHCKLHSFDHDEATPRAVVQVANPIALGIKFCDSSDCTHSHNSGCSLPPHVSSKFDGTFNCCNPKKLVCVSLGIFSIVHLERDVSMLIPAYDFCIPSKECVPSNPTDDPCELFKRIKFPTDEFFPPKLDTCEE